MNQKYFFWVDIYSMSSGILAWNPLCWQQLQILRNNFCRFQKNTPHCLHILTFSSQHKQYVWNTAPLSPPFSLKVGQTGLPDNTGVEKHTGTQPDCSMKVCVCQLKEIVPLVLMLALHHLPLLQRWQTNTLSCGLSARPPVSIYSRERPLQTFSLGSTRTYGWTVWTESSVMVYGILHQGSDIVIFSVNDFAQRDRSPGKKNHSLYTVHCNDGRVGKFLSLQNTFGVSGLNICCSQNDLFFRRSKTTGKT